MNEIEFLNIMVRRKVIKFLFFSIKNIILQMNQLFK